LFPSNAPLAKMLDEHIMDDLFAATASE